MSISRPKVLPVIALGLLAAAMIAFVLLLSVHWVSFARQQCRVAVIMLHQVVTDQDAPSRYAMREGELARQLETLLASDVRILSESELFEYLSAHSYRESGACPWSGRAAVVTFDMDGASHHPELALPHLVRLRVPAIFFVPTGFLDQGRAVTSAGVEGLASAGMSIGSHSMWHQDLTNLDRATRVAELTLSRDTLTALSGRSVRAVAAPGGRYDADVLRDAESAGFDAFFTSDPCYVTPGSSPLQICRIEIRGHRGPTMLDAARTSGPVAWQATQWQVKRLVERIVGDHGWSTLSSLRR
jgi:peptidoglycan/xylan/chitin deacetylase (PgdA/CDA1 family)